MSVIWGCLKNEYIEGYEGSPQFRSLQLPDLQAALAGQNDVEVLQYFQRDINYIFQELDFSAVIFINGSWDRSLHHRPEIWTLINKKVPYKLVSPFISEAEAKKYAERMTKEVLVVTPIPQKKLSDERIFDFLNKLATRSFATDFRTSACLVKDGRIVLASHNMVVPYETYAWHHGPIKEQHFSPVNDLNHFDTVHAEVNLLIEANKSGVDLRGSTLYINLMPCPTCARMLTQVPIKEIVYQHDHSDGYATLMLTRAGKQIRRFIHT